MSRVKYNKNEDDAEDKELIYPKYTVKAMYFSLIFSCKIGFHHDRINCLL